MNWKISLRAHSVAFLLALFLTAPSLARIPFLRRTFTVDDDGPADFNNIQAAIDEAKDGNTIEVQPGTYTGPGNYRIRFNGKAITVRGTNPEDFEVVAETVIDCNHQGPGFIFDNDEYPNSVLTGLTITNGRSASYWGGGIECRDTRPTIRNCILVGNYASKYGGGISSRDADLTIKNCLIIDNYAGSLGGGVYAGLLNFAKIDSCTITRNTARSRGGGIYGSSSVHCINKCIITGNKSGFMGGGIATRIGEVIITGCTISGNVAASTGGGFSGIREAEPTISNCIIAGNNAPLGPQVDFLDPYYNGSERRSSLSWCAIQGGQDEMNLDPNCALDWGPGNIDADPCFVNPGYWGHIADTNMPVEPNDPNAAWVDGDSDYHLKSQAGTWNPAKRSWILHDATSLCIDAGDPNLPLGFEPFPNGGRINMGVYGATSEASKSYFGKPPCETIVAGDVNGDCAIDGWDLALLAGNWLISGPLSPIKATNPTPIDGATDVSVKSILTWTPGYSARSHDIYFGINSPGTFQGNQTGTAFYPGQLSGDTTYYWRIDEVNSTGTAAGDVWSFTTESVKLRMCFPADTPVWVDGEMVEISKVVVGAMVDKPVAGPTITNLHKTVCVHQIEGVDVHDEFDCWDRYDIVFENGNTLSVADSHYFLLDSGKWTPLQKLATGSKLSTLEGSVTIKAVRKAKSGGTVYNLKIKNSDRYLVGKDGIIVRDW